MEQLDGTVIATALPQMANSFRVAPVDLNIGMAPATSSAIVRGCREAALMEVVEVTDVSGYLVVDEGCIIERES